MMRRILCILCAVLLLIPALPAAAGESGGSFSYDFDLTFSLNSGSFPKLQRSRTEGYALLAECIGLKGNIAWSADTQSMELDAVLYYRDNPSLSYPFRLFGTKARLFVTSPLINNEVIYLDMSCLMEYAIKVQNYLSIPLPYFVFLVPYSDEYALGVLANAWNSTIGSFTESGTVSVDQFRALSDQWSELLQSHVHLQRWITALADGSSDPEVTATVNSEFENLPSYYEYVTLNQPLTVTVGNGGQTWKNAEGKTLFTSCESEGSFSLDFSLPASKNRYIPSLSFTRSTGESTFSFDLEASVCQEDYPIANESTRNVSASAAETASEDTDGEDETVYVEIFENDEEDELDARPGLLLYVSAEAEDLPSAYPDDSSFTVNATVRGTVYPNYSFYIKGETKKDGAVSLSLCKPYVEGTEPVRIFTCSGTVLPAETREIPDYMLKSLSGTHNAFSFNEQSLAVFTRKVVPSLVRSLISFVEAAPTAACQSFLDDLTDSGVLGMLLD